MSEYRHIPGGIAMLVAEHTSELDGQTSVMFEREDGHVMAGWKARYWDAQAVATEKQWNDARQKVIARRERAADVLAYGLHVEGIDGRLVSITRTQLVFRDSVSEGRYQRRTGRSKGYRYLSRGQLAEIEKYAAGRERVDVVAERKREAEASQDRVGTGPP
jgi:hypothetical protein